MCVCEHIMLNLPKLLVASLSSVCGKKYNVMYVLYNLSGNCRELEFGRVFSILVCIIIKI